MLAVSDYFHTLVVNPDTNKVFAFGLTAEKVIDSSDDTYTTLATGYHAQAAAYDSVSGRIFLVAIKNTETDSTLYAFDGSTGH